MPFDRKAWALEWRRKHPERAREISRESWRRSAKDPENRAKWRARDAAYYRANKDQRLEKGKAWAAKNHEKVLVQAHIRYARTDVRKRYALRANRKAAQYGRPGELLDWTRLPLGPWFCHYCGSVCESWDHVEQLALGGPNTVENLVPSCLPCNQKRPRSHRVVRTSCRRGHPYDSANTLLTMVGRRCRACSHKLYLAAKVERQAEA